MKKFLTLLLVAILSLTTFIGCGENGDDKKGGGDEGKEISVMLDNKDRAFWEASIADFEAKTGYKVNPIWSAGGTLQSDQAMKIGTGNAPDIIVGGDMYTEVYRRNVMDLTELIERDKAELDMDDFVDGVIDNLKTSDGKIVFMPRFFNISLLYYNKSLFDADREALLNAGITPAPEGTPENELHYPHENWTIEDYFKAGGVLTKYSTAGVPTQFGSTTVGGWWGEWLIHFRQCGVDLFNSEGLIGINNEKGIKAMEIWRDKAYGSVERNRPKIAVAPGESDLGGFQSQKAAMEYGGHTASWPRYDSIEGLEWGVTVLPIGLETRNGAEYAIEGMGIYKNTKAKEAAWAFLKYVSGKEMGTEMAESGYIPIRKSVYANMADGKNKERCALAMEAVDANGRFGAYACTLPKYEYFNEISALIDPIIGLMNANDSTRLSFEDGLRKIENDANAIILLNYT